MEPNCGQESLDQPFWPCIPWPCIPCPTGACNTGHMIANQHTQPDMGNLLGPDRRGRPQSDYGYASWRVGEITTSRMFTFCGWEYMKTAVRAMSSAARDPSMESTHSW